MESSCRGAQGAPHGTPSALAARERDDPVQHHGGNADRILEWRFERGPVFNDRRIEDYDIAGHSRR